MSEKLPPNILAQKLNERAKGPEPDADGLPENEAAYVRGVHVVFAKYRARKINKDQADAERRDLQRRYLQRPLIEETIEKWKIPNT